MASKLEKPPTQVVWAIDVLSAVVSLAKVTEPAGGGVAGRPEIGVVPVNPLSAFSPHAQWSRSKTVADKVFATITANSTVRPTLVVIAKQQWGPLTSSGRKGQPAADPTAQRRMMLQALIEDRLHEVRIPVAEFPYPTALRWLHGSSQHTGPTMKALADAVAENFDIEVPTVESKVENGKDRPAAFRPQVAALAAIGAAAVGIRTAVPRTMGRMAAIHGEGNHAVQWPGRLTYDWSHDDTEKEAS